MIFVADMGDGLMILIPREDGPSRLQRIIDELKDETPDSELVMTQRVRDDVQ